MMLMVSVAPSAPWAQIVIEEVQPLTLGKVAIIKNDKPYVYSISHMGEKRIDAAFKVIEPAEVGLFRVAGLPASSHINTEVSTTNTFFNTASPPPELLAFEINGYDDPIRTDPAGEAILRVGGKLTTSGSGSLAFSDSQQTANIKVTINF